MPVKPNHRSKHARQEVAAEAARIIATEGQRSYLAAKQKAAARLGVATRGGLPSNSEIERALKDWQTVFGGPEHASVLAQLRRDALAAMRFFDAFRPRLVGPVLEGTADEYSRICLHLFADDPDALVHFLIQNRIPFEQEVRRVRWHDGDYRQIDVIVLQAGDQTVELSLMIGRDGLQAPPSPIDGRPMRRASIKELESLVEED